MLVLFRKTCSGVAVRKLKDLLNPNFCKVWVGTEADAKILETVQRNKHEMAMEARQRLEKAFGG